MPLSLSTAYHSPIQMILRAIIKELCVKKNGPVWPKSNPQRESFLPTQASRPNDLIPPHAHTSELSPQNSHSSPKPTLSLETDAIRSDPQMNASFNPLPIQTMSQKQKQKRRKGNEQPLRRSTRIQAKQGATIATPKKLSKTGTQTKGIAFDFNTQDTPLDVSSTLAILQTTGLVIDKKVEDTIEQAFMKDRADSIAEQQMPSTPVHDLIPPLAIPGFDLLF